MAEPGFSVLTAWSATVESTTLSASYNELLAGIRQENSKAVPDFRNTFTPGIQFFVARESNETDVVGPSGSGDCVRDQRDHKGAHNQSKSRFTNSRIATSEPPSA